MSDTLENYIRHIKDKHTNACRAVQCKFPQCGYKSILPESLMRHMAVKHNEYIKNRRKGVRNIVFWPGAPLFGASSIS